MRKAAAPADLQRWSEEVARDPGAPSFVPLSDAYRRQGNREAAVRVCLRGLERNPSNVEAHLLLARLYLESSDRERAHDEWGIALRLDPENFEAHRGIGFVHLERGDFGTARGHLTRAAASRPDDPAVQEALSVLADRLGGAGGSASPAPVESATPAPVATPAQAIAPAPFATPVPSAPPADAPLPVTTDPTALFEPLRRETPFLGAVILDANGLVLAGTFSQEGGDAEALGAILSGAIGEAARTAQLLQLGSWQGMLLETEWAQLHITALPDDLMVLLAAHPSAPAGWVLRTAQRASELSRAFLGGGA
ncbi:MAG TPA: tetratricopeptide repeat protein [Longimicrobiales bacterium]